MRAKLEGLNAEGLEGERALMLEGLKVAKCQSGRQLAGSGLDAGHRNDFRCYDTEERRLKLAATLLSTISLLFAAVKHHAPRLTVRSNFGQMRY